MPDGPTRGNEPGVAGPDFDALIECPNPPSDRRRFSNRLCSPQATNASMSSDDRKPPVPQKCQLAASSGVERHRPRHVVML